jgi:hypothetical protein
MSISDMRGDGARSPDRRSRRFLKSKRTWAVLAAACAAVLAMAIAIPAAQAVHDTGAFELDGNATNSSTVPGDDWDNVCHQVTGTDCSTTSNTNGATAVDWVAEPNLNSSIFTGGGSKDPQDVSNWAWKDAGGLPDKDNLLHSFAARYSLTPDATHCPSNGGSTCEVLYFGSDRYDNSGDAQQGFWFFQNEITQNNTPSGGGSGFTGVHVTGDLLVISDFSNGGTTSTINVYEWNPACTKTGVTVGGHTCGDANLLLLAGSNSAKCAATNQNPGDQFCGLVNPSTITMPWSFTDKSGTPNNGALNGEFYEGGVNLSSLGLADRCFSSVAAETRSSTSTTATLKDFTLGKLGSCNAHLTTHESTGGSTSIGTGSASVSDQATVTVNGVSTWTGTLQFSLQGPIGSALETTQNIGGPITVTNATTQPVQSNTATVTAVGNYCWHATFTSGTTGVPNASDDGTNECFTVTPVTPTLATHAGAGPVHLGDPITDTATLNGTANKPGTPAINPTTAGGPAGGTITFTAYGPNNCTTVAFTSSAVPVSGDGTYGPVSFTPTAPGTYHWAATYTGDPPNTNGTSHNLDCSDTSENVTVTDTTASTSAQTWLPNDSATVTSAGGAALNGTLSVQLYTGDNCGATSGSAVSGQLYQRTLTNASSPASLTTNNTTFTVSASSSVSWLVTFTSTDPNVAGSSHCESTSLTITN